MHITMTGNLGSGKSTISKIMADKYGYEIYSTGKILRELAEEKGLTVLEMNQLMQSDPSYDHVIDDRTKQLSVEKKEDVFFDSRLAWHFAENTFKVFLSVNINEAARRVFGDNRGDVETYKSIEDCKAQLQERAHTEDVRYKDLYDIDYFKLGNYNLVIDSTFSKPETLAEIVISEKKRYEELMAAGNPDAGKTRIIVSPARLLGHTAGNTRDNEAILESEVVIKQGAEDFEVVSGLDMVEKADREGYEFICVTE